MNFYKIVVYQIKENYTDPDLPMTMTAAASTKPSSFSVKDILDLPEGKGGQRTTRSPAPRPLDLSDVTLPAFCYGGLCPDVTYSRWLASEIIPAYAALRE